MLPVKDHKKEISIYGNIILRLVINFATVRSGYNS